MPPVRSNKPQSHLKPAALETAPGVLPTPAGDAGGPAPSETAGLGAWENEGGLAVGKTDAPPGVSTTGGTAQGTMPATLPPGIRVTRKRVVIEVPMLRFDEAMPSGRVERIDLALTAEESRGFLLLQQALNDEKIFQGYGRINKQEPIKWLLRRLVEEFDKKSEGGG